MSEFKCKSCGMPEDPTEYSGDTSHPHYPAFCGFCISERMRQLERPFAPCLRDNEPAMRRELQIEAFVDLMHGDAQGEEAKILLAEVLSCLRA